MTVEYKGADHWQVKFSIAFRRKAVHRHLRLMVLLGLWENLQVALRHEPKFSGYWLIVVGITSSFSLSIVWIDF